MMLKVILLLTTALVLKVILVDGCSCFLDHPQNMFCEAEFAILAVPKDVKNSTVFFQHYLYTVEVINVYKGNMDVGDLVKIRTGQHSALCGLVFWLPGQRCERWLLTGTKVPNSDVYRISLCGLNRLWRTYEQKEFITGNNYKNNCKCEIKSCPKPPCGDTFCPLLSPTPPNCPFYKIFCKRTNTGKCRWAGRESRSCPCGK